MIIFLIIW